MLPSKIYKASCKKTQNLHQCFSKWAESPPWGRFLCARGRKNKGGDRGAKKHKGAKVLNDLWLVSFSQILIYYDNCWRLLLKHSICWILTLDCICARVQGGLFHVCEPSWKWHSSGSGALLFMNMAPAPELLVLMSVAPAPELSFFMAPAPASVRFHTLIF